MKSGDKAVNILHKIQRALPDHSANTYGATSRAQMALWMSLFFFTQCLRLLPEHHFQFGPHSSPFPQFKKEKTRETPELLG